MATTFKKDDLVICQGRKCICVGDQDAKEKVLIAVLQGEKQFRSDFQETNMIRTKAKNLKRIEEKND